MNQQNYLFAGALLPAAVDGAPDRLQNLLTNLSTSLSTKTVNTNHAQVVRTMRQSSLLLLSASNFESPHGPSRDNFDTRQRILYVRTGINGTQKITTHSVVSNSSQIPLGSTMRARLPNSFLPIP